eukprot:3831047-Rhodomonas_salina.2
MGLICTSCSSTVQLEGDFRSGGLSLFLKSLLRPGLQPVCNWAIAGTCTGAIAEEAPAICLAMLVVARVARHPPEPKHQCHSGSGVGIFEHAICRGRISTECWHDDLKFGDHRERVPLSPRNSLGGHTRGKKWRETGRWEHVQLPHSFFSLVPIRSRR